MRILGRIVAAVLAVAVIAVLAVVVVDRWRASDVRPDGCSSLLVGSTRGEQGEDAGVIASAWSALVDLDSGAIGRLDGSRPVLARSCVVYAGRAVPDGPSTVVFLETTVTGRTVLLRIAEVRLDGNVAQRAVVGYPVLIGDEIDSGLVLPLSGHYLAPADVTAVQVIGATGGAGSVARRVADGLFDLGVVPDRSRGPAEQVADAPATLVLERSRSEAGNLVVLPVVLRDGSQPVRTPLGLIVDDRRRTDPVTQQAVLAVLPLLYADLRLPALLGQAPGFPSLDVRTGLRPDGREVTVGAGGSVPLPGLPFFRYLVPPVGPAVII